MSADNFNHVRRVLDEWRVWLNLCASSELEPQLAAKAHDAVFTDKCAAIDWADSQGYVEYGTRVDEGPGPDVTATEWAHNLELQQQLTRNGLGSVADDVRQWLDNKVTRGGFIDYHEFLSTLMRRYAMAVRLLSAAKDRL